MTKERLTPEENAMIQTWPAMRRNEERLGEMIDRIEDIYFDKVMHDHEKLAQIGKVIDPDAPPDEPGELK